MAAIDPRFLDCTFYVYKSVADARAGRTTGGCGVLIGWLPQAGVTNDLHVYAVTNGHVLDAGGHVLRFSTPTGDVDILDTQPDQWIHAPDDDIAVLRVEREGGFHRYVPSDLFLDELCHIGEWPIFPGDDVEFFGRFIRHDGKQLNKPVMRFGNIAMLPDPEHTVRVHQKKQQLAFLVECRSLSGFSGSPAFVRLAQPRQTHPTSPQKHAWVPNTVSFLGIDCGHFPNWSQARKDPKEDAPLVDNVYVETNSGIAIVVPAWRIRELLERKDLVEQRQQMERNAEQHERDASAVILDSAEHEPPPIHARCLIGGVPGGGTMTKKKREEKKFPQAPVCSSAELQAEVERLGTVLNTLIYWMAQSANSPISRAEAQDLLERVGRR